MNNIELIKPLLVFDDDDTFYHLQIIKRKKENPELGSNSYIVKTYYVSSLQYLDFKMPEIITLCDYHNARACINLNKRSFEKVALHMLKKVTDCILNKSYKDVRKAYESVCGSQSNAGSDKRWIIDIDTFDFKARHDIIKFMRKNGIVVSETIITEIPTENGYHLITKPFRLDLFLQQFPELDVHKNNPTLLYWKDETEQTTKS